MTRIRTFLALVRTRLGEYALVSFLRVLIFGVSIQLVAFLTRRFFNGLTGEVPLRFGPYALIALLVAAAIVRAAIIFLDIPIHFRMQFGLTALMRRNAFVHVLDQPGANALPSSPGEAISRFRGDTDLAAQVVDQSPFLTANAISALFSIGVMISIDPLVTALVFAPVVIMVAAIELLRARVQSFRKASREAAGAVTGLIGDMFGYIEAVKVANAEGRMIRRFRDLNRTRQTTAVRDQVFTAGLNALFQNAASIGTGIVLIAIAEAMKTGSFTVGDFALFVSYIGIITNAVVTASQVLLTYKQANVSIDRIAEIFGEDSDPRARIVEPAPVYLSGSLPEVAPLLRQPEDRLDSFACRGLSYAYPDSNAGVRNADLEVQRGELVVVTGRIGSGKTTLLRLLLGLLSADEGELIWNGRQITDPVSFLRPPVTAYTPQNPRLFSDTLLNNVLLGLEVPEGDLTAAIESAVLSADIPDLEHGMQTMVGPRGVKLSGGQKQRAAAARMLVRDPELLVFDDLSSALDVHTEQRLWERLLGSDRESTIIAVSHRPFLLRMADRIVVLKEGRIDAEGSIDELLPVNAELRALWDGDVR